MRPCWFLPEPRDENLTFELNVGNSLPGRVVSDLGAPVARARVEVNSNTRDVQGTAVAVSDDGGNFLLEGMGTRAETIALWREVTGISTDDIEWYEDFATIKLAILSVRMGHLKGAPLPTEAWPDNPIFRGLAQRLGIAWPA